MDSVPPGSGIVTLKRNDEFLRIFKRGRYAAGKYFTVHALANGSANGTFGRPASGYAGGSVNGFTKVSTDRLGISVGRKVGNSVRRNRFRRLLKENYRLLKPFITKGFDVVIAARPCSGDLPGYQDISREMLVLLKRLRLIKPEREPEMQENL